jgi:hypothetical protein
MAKRYHSDMQGSSRMGSGYYEGPEERRRQEMEDGGMLREDRSQIANLPQEVMMKMYPKPDYARYDLNDTIAVVDRQMNDDGKEKKKGAYPEKY